MAERRYLSTSQVSDALGVSVTTVKRWVDEGILPAHKTPGGHRRLLLSDVLRITREGHFPKLDLGRLRLAAEADPADPARLCAPLFTALRQGVVGPVRSLLLGAYQSGIAVEALADVVVAPALHRLGQEWEKGRADVLHEHRATLLCAGALHQVKALIEGNAGNGGRPRAVGGGPECDPYLLTNLLAEMVLLDGGWEVINLGPNTPLASFRRALLEFRPQLVWLSVSHLEDASAFGDAYRELYQEAARQGAAVVLGGRALTAEVRAGLPCTTFGDGLTHLAAFSRALHPPPRRSGRGRPLGS
jgi:excisionase family DNA binding protein